MTVSSEDQPDGPRSAKEAIRESVRRGAALNRDYVAMNAFSAIVATYGLLSNSAAVVIGAMIIATLLGPIIGIALAVTEGDYALLRSSFFAEFAGVVVVLVIALGFGYMHREIPLTQEILSRTKPNILDLMIALGGGAAGAYATVSPRLSVGLVGVAIATALVPPLAVSSICLAHGSPSMALGGLLLFVTNFVAIQFAASVVLWLHGYNFLTTVSPLRRMRFGGIAVSLVTLVILGGVLALNLTRSVQHEQFESLTRSTLKSSLRTHPGAFLADLRFVTKDGKALVFAVVRSRNSITPEDVKLLEAKLPDEEGLRPELHVRSVLTKEATSSGYVKEESTNSEQDYGNSSSGN